VFNKIRAYKPFPGTFAYLEEKRLGIVWARPSGDETAHEPGTIIKVTNSCIEVACGPGSLLIMEVKPEGRKSMSVHDFLLGTTIKEGTSLTWMPVN
jgi:methionyl-tRNA formyltransferase